MNRAATVNLVKPSGNAPVMVLPLGLRAIVTVAVMMATIMEILDTTIVNVALPDMMGNLANSGTIEQSHGPAYFVGNRNVANDGVCLLI